MKVVIAMAPVIRKGQIVSWFESQRAAAIPENTQNMPLTKAT
jgi:hypothetical protein